MTNYTETEYTIPQSPSAVAELHAKAAFKAYVASKDFAMQAVAHVYLVYHNTLSDDGKDWLEKQIAKRNDEIVKHNDAIPARKETAAAFKAELSKNPQAVASKQVMEDANLTEEEWTLEKRSKIDTPRKGASSFTTICRLVLHFDHEYHASNTSRYCAILEWLDAKFKNHQLTSITPLVNALKDAGGFEKVLFMQRHGEPDEAGYSAGDRDIIEKALKNKIKKAIAAADAKTSFSMAPSYATSDNVVVMYGRYDNGTVAIIDELPLENSEIDGMLRKLNNKALLPVDDATEFVSRVLSLGELIDTGKETTHRVSKIAGAKLAQEYSLLSMVPDGAGSKLLISGCMTSASVVVHAKPGAKIAENLVQTQDYLYMLKPSRNTLAAKLRDRTERSLYELSRDPVPVLNNGKASGSAMSWCLTNTALSEEGRDTAERRLFWGYMAKDNYQPVDVELYDEHFSVTITQAGIGKLFIEHLKQFKSVSPNKKGAQPMKLKFEADKLTVIFKGQNDYVLPITAALDKAFELTLRPKDVFNLFAKLHQFGVCDVTLSGNISGVFKASFSDETGDYDVYIPTCVADLSLWPKFFAKINAPVPVHVSAEVVDAAVADVEIAETEADAVLA
jgi:hypothetical protein